MREGVGGRTELQHIDPHTYGPQRCVFLVLKDRAWGPRGQPLWVLASSTASCL